MENIPAKNPVDDTKSNPDDVSVPILSPQDIPTVLGGLKLEVDVVEPQNTITQEFAALQLQEELASMQLQFQKEVSICLLFFLLACVSMQHIR